MIIAANPSGLTSPRGPAGRRQRGQALIWLLGTLAASVAVLYGVYNVGQLTNAKQKVVNAADAAALAGATIEARALNLMAYNNRAVIANEVFMVQAVAMEGWFQYIKTTSGNIAPYVSWIPYIGEVLGPLLEYIDEAATFGEEALQVAIPVMVKALEVFKLAVNTGHGAAKALGSVGAYQAATDVVAANKAVFGAHQDAGLGVDDRPAVKVFSFTRNGAQWLNFTRQYSGSERVDAKDILLRSRDEFTGKSRPGAGWMTPSLGLVGFEKQGGTQLLGYDRWETQDTYEFWAWRPCGKSPLPKKCYDAIGWGRSNLDKSGSGGGTWSPNRDAQKNARSDGDTNGGWSGVPALYDVANKEVKDRESLGVDFVVAVKRDKAATLTTSTMGIGKAASGVPGASDMDEQALGGQMSAIGKARVSFQRPQSGIGDKTASGLLRHDSAKEYGSLYSPFWQARLVDVTVGERTAYMLALGMGPADAAAAAKFTPGAQ
jgi:hypothetical protein